MSVTWQIGQRSLIFLGHHYLVVEPQAAEFMELLEQFYEIFRAGLNASSSPSERAASIIRWMCIILASKLFCIFKKADLFFCLLPPSAFCLHLSPSRPAFGLFVSLLSLTPACTSC